MVFVTVHPLHPGAGPANQQWPASNCEGVKANPLRAGPPPVFKFLRRSGGLRSAGAFLA
jgi:hypothetical protein